MLLCSIVSALAMDIAAISQCTWRKRIFPLLGGEGHILSTKIIPVQWQHH